LYLDMSSPDRTVSFFILINKIIRNVHGNIIACKMATKEITSC